MHTLDKITRVKNYLPIAPNTILPALSIFGSRIFSLSFVLNYTGRFQLVISDKLYLTVTSLRCIFSRPPPFFLVLS